MFGIGSLTKEIVHVVKRELSRNSQAGFLYRVAPRYKEYKRLFHLSNDIIISKKHRYVYVANLKVASTSVRNRLWELEGNAPLEDPTKIWNLDDGLPFARDCTADQIYQAFHDPDWFRFSFVRNPYARLVSGYRFLLTELDPMEKAKVKHRIGPKSTYNDPRFNREMSFPVFVDIACGKSTHWRDPHLHRQVDLLKTSVINYDFIGKMENLDHDLSHVLHKLNAPQGIVERVHIVTNKSGGQIQMADWFTADLQDLVCKHYEEDFTQFGYSFDLPG